MGKLHVVKIDGINVQFEEMGDTARKGDKILVTSDVPELTQGKLYTADMNADSDGDLDEFEEIPLITGYLHKGEYVVVRETGIVEINGKNYRKLDRPAVKGDLIALKAEVSKQHFFTTPQIVEAIDDEKDNSSSWHLTAKGEKFTDSRSNSTQVLRRNEYIVVEPLEVPKVTLPYEIAEAIEWYQKHIDQSFILFDIPSLKMRHDLSGNEKATAIYKYYASTNENRRKYFEALVNGFESEKRPTLEDEIRSAGSTEEIVTLLKEKGIDLA